MGPIVNGPGDDGENSHGYEDFGNIRGAHIDPPGSIIDGVKDKVYIKI